MKKYSSKTILSGLIIVILLGLFSLTNNFNAINKVNTITKSIDCVKLFVINKELNKHELIIDSLYLRVNENFDYIFPKFNRFNKNIDTSTVEFFSRVMHFYDLDSTNRFRELYTGQILLESGAKQYKSNGKLVISSAGAIGICQILPTTCLGYLTKRLDSIGYKEIKLLGGTDFSFVFNNKLSKSEKINKSKDWLSKINNNIIMWGIISKYNLNKRNNNIIKQLVSYNMGTTGTNNYINNGGDVNKHKYINGIKTKLNVCD